jgi:hypothetical protein
MTDDGVEPFDPDDPDAGTHLEVRPRPGPPG